ncbi:MAG: DUF3656 domain-containing protein [Clostridia bacterium]|nr:DUF3656 domain-containing protein [Clostridia bacterium]
MTELLAPAGDIRSFKAAISKGCDAVYLGLKNFGARAYSDNFDLDELKEVIDYAHLRDVKVYVTVNTIIFEDELPKVKETLRKLNEMGVDGVIVQDLAALKYVSKTFQDMECHSSTQMGIDDLEGALLCKELGVDRIVLARETPFDKVKEIREKTGLPMEVFVHGALCVSYSGNCLMSGLIGYRSGNRGRCVGSCRKPYELFEGDKSLGTSYLLSTKDLNTIDHMDDLKAVDSLKIEGRMKEPEYVANVVDIYRKKLDGKKVDTDLLLKTFNRTYTCGYMFGEDKKDITNIDRPNNYGYEVGVISGKVKGMWEITLTSTIYQKDIIRIDHRGEDVNLSLVKIYDQDGKLINKATKKGYIKIKENLSAGDKVYMTKDYAFNKGLTLEGEYRRFPLDMDVYAYPGKPLTIKTRDYTYISDAPLEEAKTNPTNVDQVRDKLSKLGDSVFTLGELTFNGSNAFVPATLLNQARRKIVEETVKAKVDAKKRRTTLYEDTFISMAERETHLVCQVRTKEQYDAAKEMGIDEIYFENVIPRNQNEYIPKEGTLLIGGLGGIYTYRNTNEFITDYSLNVVNATTVNMLHKLGAKRVTLSYELNKKQIQDVLDGYKGHPALEMIVYGRAPLMVTKYCPLKKFNLCGKCTKNTYTIRDEYGEFIISPTVGKDCLITILNGKTLNLLDEIKDLQGIEAFRLNFTTEPADEVKRVIALARDKNRPSCFNPKLDTRGHFNKEIL